MKKLLSVFVVALLALALAGCQKKDTLYRMEKVTFYQNGESVTVFAEELKAQMPQNYEPNSGLYDNYFFTLRFGNNDEGKAIFVFSELGENYKDAIADTFTIEEKSGGRITLTFTNGQTLSGEKTHNKLTLSSNGVTYVFEKQ